VLLEPIFYFFEKRLPEMSVILYSLAILSKKADKNSASG